MIDQIRIIEAEGHKWLGILDESIGLINSAVEWDSSRGNGAPSLRRWITLWNLGELTTVRLSKNAGFTEVSLDVDQKRRFKRYWEDMQEIKRTALQRLENQYFEERFK